MVCGYVSSQGRCLLSLFVVEGVALGVVMVEAVTLGVFAAESAALAIFELAGGILSVLELAGGILGVFELAGAALHFRTLRLRLVVESAALGSMSRAASLACSSSQASPWPCLTSRAHDETQHATEYEEQSASTYPAMTDSAAVYMLIPMERRCTKAQGEFQQSSNTTSIGTW